MTRADESVERLLAGLRDAEVPDGMELRVREALERGSLAQRDRVGVQSWGKRAVASGVAAAVVFAVALGVFGVGRRHGHPSAAGVGSERVHVAPRLEVTRGVEIAAVPKAAPVRVRPVAREDARRRRDDEDALARSEMLAPSRPAPEVPLTEQEKLLLRVAHRGDPEELAMLNPEMRAKAEAEDKAEFQRFFGQRTSEDHE